MAYAILVVAELPPDGSVAWPFRIQLADKTADVINPSVDLLVAAFWFVSVKMQVKAAVGANSVILQSADALAGTGNVQQLGPSTTLGTAILGAFLLQGWFPRSQEFLNIDVTIATSMTYDAEVWATPMK